MGTKRKFNVIDAFILLAVLAVLVAVGVRFFMANYEELTAVQQQSQVHLAIDSTARRHITTFSDGTQVYFSCGTFAGTVARTSNRPALIPDWDNEGNFTPATDIGRVDLTVVLDTSGIILEHGFFHGGNTHIASGMELELVVNNHVFTALVTQISR